MKRSYVLFSLLIMALLLVFGFGTLYAMAGNLHVVPPSLPMWSMAVSGENPTIGNVDFQAQEISPTPVTGEEGGGAVPTDDLAAVVNGRTITKDAYDKQVKLARLALESQGYDLSSEEGAQIFATVRRQMLEDMISLIVIEQAAATQGITVTQQAVTEAMDKSIEENGGRAGFEQWLKQTDQTEDDYRDMIRAQLLTLEVGEAQAGNLPDKAPQAHVRHILVDSEEKAQDVLSQLQNGGDFAALAKDTSIDQVTKDQGGELGWLPRQMLPDEIDKVVFASEVGLIPEVVPDSFGTFHVLEVLEKDPQRELTEEQTNALKAKAFQTWLTKQRQGAQIERFITFED